MKITTELKMATIVGTALGISLCVGVSASADLIVGSNVMLTFAERDPGRDVEIELGSSDFETKAGIYNWEGGLQTFCIQLTDSISVGQTVTYDVVEVSNVPYGEGSLGSARTTLINDLYARWFNYYEYDGWNSRRAAAFQIVLWEIRHETSNGTTAAEILEDLNIEHGYAEFDSDHYVDATAEYLLDSLGGDDRETFMHYNTLVGLTSDYAQDHITIGNSSPQTIPGAVGLASGIGLLGLKRRKRRRG